MNRLDRIILDQYSRVKSTNGDPLAVLNETQGEILEAATPELTLEIIVDSKRVNPEQETRSLTAIMRSQQDSKSVGNRATSGIRTANGLAQIGMLASNQGYVGGIVFDHGEPTVHGHSAVFNQPKEDDAIQDAMGTTFYPPMMWVKALRAATYESRPESARFLSVAEYLAKLGLSLGSMVGEYGDLLGATGFMPGERLQGEWDNPLINEHIESETIEAFRLSGLCDQAVVDPNILRETPQFAEQIIRLGGSLN